MTDHLKGSGRTHKLIVECLTKASEGCVVVFVVPNVPVRGHAAKILRQICGQDVSLAIKFRQDEVFFYDGGAVHIQVSGTKTEFERQRSYWGGIKPLGFVFDHSIDWL